MATVAASVGIAVRTLLSILACVMAAAIAYLLAVHGLYTCFDPRDWWMHVMFVDFCIIIAVIGAWFAYKESSWIKAAAFYLLLFWTGSLRVKVQIFEFGEPPCCYMRIIVLQFYKLSPEESSKDPLYFVFKRSERGDVMDHRREFSVVTARVIFSALGCLMLGTFIYTLIANGSPFQSGVLTPCMVAILIDISIHVVVFSIWVAYKESSWTSAFFWIILLACFRSIAICVYIVRELFYLSSQQPISLIIFNKSNRQVLKCEPLFHCEREESRGRPTWQSDFRGLALFSLHKARGDTQSSDPLLTTTPSV
ncbi:hypothetical protein OSB04_025675 [Centaurea solstitialis]|uniref:Transmembrane protein n=1 Tax=Centaurea solstitialis TaxID=347529 RepID=A0AA38SP45_9ASTR|nr:hypothetical protein OSB04_025675 [Centaurea solstitialis]